MARLWIVGVSMKAGMLWFDNDPKIALSAKIERAVDYYKHKYGRDPNLCLIHPSMLPPDPPAVSAASLQTGELGLGGKNITVRLYRPVLPGHLWIGIEENGK